MVHGRSWMVGVGIVAGVVMMLAVALPGTVAAQKEGAYPILAEAQEAADGVLGTAPNAGPPPPMVPAAPAMDMNMAAVGAGIAALLFAGGIRHITRSNVLDHPARQKIHSYLWETGGANLRTISDALELSTTNAMWHLDKLAKSELVGEIQANGYKMYYPRGAGRIARDLCLAKGVLSNDNARAVLDAVMHEPGTHQREIARTLGINHGTVRWHLQRLSDAGLVEAMDGTARARGFAATDLGRQAVARPQGDNAPVSQVSHSNI